MNVNDLKARNPIEEVVARYVPLRKRGSVLVGLCPFHQETHPSLTVWPQAHSRSGWYCFGCGQGGDVIDFIMKIEGVGFREACRLLEGELLPEPIALPPKVVVGKGQKTRQGNDAPALGLAQRVYHARLWALSPLHPARQYLKERLVDPDTIRRFGIGWCSGEDLLPAARFLHVKQEALLDAGLLMEKERFLEFFQSRIVFPDRSPDGTTCHMVGRSLGSREPRYLALPGRPKPLYGLNIVQRKLPVVITEGIFCMLSLWRYGIQAVAVMGTALGAEQARTLKAIPELVWVPQNDSAGEAAVQAWLEAVGHGRIVRLPTKVKDINDLDRLGELEDWLRANMLLP